MHPIVITAISATVSVVAVYTWMSVETRLACELCMVNRRRRRLEIFCLDCDESRLFRVCNECEPDVEDACEEYHEVAMGVWK